MSEHRNRIVIAGTGSGAGKTTVTIGLMAALKRRGLQVQGFKCGPDYIDPTYHTAVTGRPSRNLDTWMLSRDTMREIFLRASGGADLSVIEGVMGLYDGKDPLSNTGSTAEISVLLESPVILVVNAQSMARSAAAVVLGYQKLDESTRIAGVIVNKCGSRGHYRLVKSAIEQECGIPVVGGLQRDGGLDIPERHLGLVPAIERGELDGLFDRAADLVEGGVDIESVLSLAGTAPALAWPKERLFSGGPSLSPGPIIAVARDAAFNFYYRENLELLEQYGASLVYFSPLAGETVPGDADGLYLGGGFPEEFAAVLAAQERAKRDLETRVRDGLPVFAECGGYMYLTRSITDRAGETHAMAGLIPADVVMQEKLAALGYREVTALRDCLLMETGEAIRGHEFHYSRLTADGEPYPYVYQTKGLRGSGFEGYHSENLMAGYTHLHFASNPKVAERFIERCLEYSRKRGEDRGRA
ncbi:cobyrinic acid a,c-diamide synthase [Paenibacillus forsythiae]|uniref:Cobyrinate a,c-diamide synthase n=1 Tax=Paenibacillus forsythiae TaxID=365616 RepID=A0ABU3HDM6_9BACL|nr:cobyrinate a,c-diamide synthase [Paenibacillus forsythiae]MDT3428924.1 cobyrinic acid a,c-diamide synthase [Paenibacillus forsythiae]